MRNTSWVVNYIVHLQSEKTLKLSLSTKYIWKVCLYYLISFGILILRLFFFNLIFDLSPQAFSILIRETLLERFSIISHNILSFLKIKFVNFRWGIAFYTKMLLVPCCHAYRPGELQYVEKSAH